MKNAQPLIGDLSTPALLLDEAKMLRNIRRLEERAKSLGVALRPHLKTAKSVDVAKRLNGGLAPPITVSTLAEAEVFFAAGFRDILYAVGIAPQKLGRIQALRRAGCDLVVVLDSVAQAKAVITAGVPSLIEIDCDGHRSGLAPDDRLVVEIGRALSAAGCLRGVMTHAGESYYATGHAAQSDFAERERKCAVSAAEALHVAGLTCPVVSIGATPTAHAARSLQGVTELRAGVHMFFDLVMAGIGVCVLDDLALTVLATVIGHQKAKGWIITDAGWTALSRDRGTAGQAVDQGFGLVCDLDGIPIPDLIVSSANQEHGILTMRPGAKARWPDLPIGTLLRIMPNHACATAAQHGQYTVLPVNPGPLETWPRFGGW